MYEFLLYLSAAVFALVCVAYARQPFASVFHPITFYLAFHGLVFVVRAFFAYYENYTFLYPVYQFQPSEAVKIRVILAANLGMLVFVAAAWRSGSQPMEFKQDHSDLAHRIRLMKPFLAMAAVLAPLALYSIYSVFTRGFAGMRLDMSTGFAINTTGNGWITDSQMMLVPLSVLIAWTFRFRWWSLLPLVGFIAFGTGTGTRGPFVVACVAVGLLWMFDNRHRWPPPRALALGLAVLALFYAIGQERSFVRQVISNGTVVNLEEQQTTSFIESMDFANLEFFQYIVNTVPAKTGTYGYFIDNLQVFTEPIPRVWWPAKPVGPPIKMFNLFDYGSPIGMTYSMPGYGWMQGGFIGVAIWCGLWGWALGTIYSRFVRGPQDNLRTAAYFAFLPIFVIAFRDGVLLTIVRTGVFYLFPVVAWWAAARLFDVPDPGELARRAARRIRRRDAPPPEEAGPVLRSRRAAGEIVPRAWRRGAAAPPTR